MTRSLQLRFRINTMFVGGGARAVGSGSVSLVLFLTLLLGACRKRETVTEIRRGPLSCTEYVERRRVNNYWWEVFINDKPYIPEGRNSNKIGQCQASRNPDVKVLVLLFGDSCQTLQLEGDKPVLTRIEKPDEMDSIEQYKSAIWSCNGRCLVWPTQMTFVDTNEVRKFPRLPSDFITFSPDLKTAVTEGVNDPEHNKLSVKLIDMQTFAVNERVLTRANYLWLLDYTDGVEGIAARFKWEAGSDSKDRLTYPAEETVRHARNKMRAEAQVSKGAASSITGRSLFAGPLITLP